VNVTAQNVTLHACALGEKEGWVSMKTAPTSSGDTFVTGHSMLAEVAGAGDIPMKRLDDFGFQDVDFLKVDCEGYELFVLRGAEEMLKRCRPCVIVEQKPGHAQKFGLPETAAVPYLQSLGAALLQEISGDFILAWK
jgi:FkbM family methyltransferase